MKRRSLAMPETPQTALRRDERIAEGMERVISEAFLAEEAEIVEALMHGTPAEAANALDPERWENALAKITVAVANEVRGVGEIE